MRYSWLEEQPFSHTHVHLSKSSHLKRRGISPQEEHNQRKRKLGYRPGFDTFLPRRPRRQLTTPCRRHLVSCRDVHLSSATRPSEADPEGPHCDVPRRPTRAITLQHSHFSKKARLSNNSIHGHARLGNTSRTVSFSPTTMA